MRRMARWVAAAVISIAIGGCSKTESTKAPDQPGARPGAVGTGGAGANVKSDGDFVHDVALMSMAEVELSRMALGKASSPDVKAFAQNMIDEHEAAGNKLKGVISGQSIDWPAQLDGKRRETADELSKKNGADFEQDYVKAMVEGHQNLAATLETRLDVQSLGDWKTAAAGRTRSQALPDPKAEMRDVPVRPDKSDHAATMNINQWAADTYPVVQKHLDTARTLLTAAKKRTTD